MKEELERPVDHETGQEWFKPKIGRKPHFVRNMAKLKIIFGKSIILYASKR